MGKRNFDPEPYLPLTPAMFQVLVALADGEKHGYAIIKEVHRRTDGKVRLSAGTLYALIKRLVLVLFPEDFRVDYESEMARTFSAQQREARSTGGATGMLRLWGETIAG